MKKTTTGFALLQRSSQHGEYELHRAGCGHSKARGFGEYVSATGATAQEAIDRHFSGEVAAMRWGLKDTRIMPCCGLTAAEKRALVDPESVETCPKCKRPWIETGCTHDDGCEFERS